MRQGIDADRAHACISLAVTVGRLDSNKRPHVQLPPYADNGRQEGTA